MSGFLRSPQEGGGNTLATRKCTSGMLSLEIAIGRISTIALPIYWSILPIDIHERGPGTQQPPHVLITKS